MNTPADDIANKKRAAILAASQKSVAEGVEAVKIKKEQAKKDGTDQIVKPTTQGLGTINPNVNKGETKIRKLGK